MTRARNHPPRLARSRAGFTLIEILVASLLIGSALVAALQSMEQSVKVQAAQAEDTLTAVTLAQEIYALALALPRGPGTGMRAISGADVTASGDLADAYFSPPIDATKTPQDDYSGWSQETSLAQVDLSDPAQAASILHADEALSELTVTVRRLGVVKGVFTWWLNP